MDLKRHKVIDLLPDRKAETAKAWMQARPEIELVSRDRGGDYAAAASQGAPQAAQIADRFHLCKNLTEAVEKALARCRAEIRKSQKAKKNQPKTPHRSSLRQPWRLLTASRTQRIKQSGMIAISKRWRYGSKGPKSKRSQNGLALACERSNDG